MNFARQNIYIVGTVRTAIGSFGGALKDHAPSTLAAACVREVVARAAVDPDTIGHVVFGNVIHTEPRDMYLSRVAAVESGLAISIPALTVNRLCGSGLQAIVSAAQALALEDCEVAVAGGVEVMSRAPYSMQTLRFGKRMGDATAVDMMTGALTDPFGNGHMGITAENVARSYQISRTDQDQFAAESHRRACHAIAEGRFKEQILPVEVRLKAGTKGFSEDEGVRSDTSCDKLSGLRPVFLKDGSVTAGNSSSISDGAAAIVLATEKAVVRGALKPLARIVGYAHAGVDPAQMGIGPIPAVYQLMANTGLKPADFDVIEVNEAFAAQSCAVSKTLELDPEKTNPNGGAISLGHPIGATGSILVVKTIAELARTSGQYGLITMCIGGGQGIAFAVERI
jgi:acetyl-CoA C-acetyltransferase